MIYRNASPKVTSSPKKGKRDLQKKHKTLPWRHLPLVNKTRFKSTAQHPTPSSPHLPPSYPLEHPNPIPALTRDLSILCCPWFFPSLKQPTVCSGKKVVCFLSFYSTFLKKEKVRAIWFPCFVSSLGLLVLHVFQYLFVGVCFMFKLVRPKYIASCANPLLLVLACLSVCRVFGQLFKLFRGKNVMFNSKVDLVYPRLAWLL